MKKIKLMLVAGVVLLMSTSCASMFEGINVDCEDGREPSNKCENFEFHMDSNCE